MLTLLAFFAFMLIPIWIILASVVLGWIGDQVKRLGRAETTRVPIRERERAPISTDPDAQTAG